MDHQVIKYNKHKNYLRRFLNILPNSCQNMDSMRVTIAFFALSGLDVLNSLESLDEQRRAEIIDWIYSLQVVDNEGFVSGFQSASTFNTQKNKGLNDLYKWSNIAATYSALCSLLVLDDDLSRLNKDAIIKSLRQLQLPNGCYKAAKDGTESDMRFVYCAAAICYILNDWAGMDVDKTVDFIIKSISYDYGIAQGPELESHGGSTYCAIATLSLTNQLHKLSKAQLTGVRRWLLYRQEDGFQGRPNKPVDTCYSFWVGGALKILNFYEFIDFAKNKDYVLLTENVTIGGFSKWVNSSSDPLHTYLGLAGLSLMDDDGLNEIFPALNITYRAHKHLLSIHEKWK